MNGLETSGANLNICDEKSLVYSDQPYIVFLLRKVWIEK